MELPLPEHVEAVGSLPQWAVNTVVWCAVLLVSILVGSYGWFVRRLIGKQDEHEKKLAAHEREFATKNSVKVLADDMKEFVTKPDLAAIVRQMSEAADHRHKEQREDRLRMHQQNLDANKELREDLQTRDEGIRDDIRGVHGRIDELFKPKS